MLVLHSLMPQYFSKRMRNMGLDWSYEPPLTVKIWKPSDENQKREIILTPSESEPNRNDQNRYLKITWVRNDQVQDQGDVDQGAEDQDMSNKILFKAIGMG